MNYKLIRRYELQRYVKIIYSKMRFRDGRYKCLSVIPGNDYYGHEYCLKEYACWEKPVYGLIEHGMCFGKNKKTLVNTDICDAVLTYGDYRYDLINDNHPEVECIRIGPLIAYCETDLAYKDLLLERARGRKTATLFPTHSIPEKPAQFDTDFYLKNVKEVCDDVGIDNIRVSLHPEDFENGISQYYKKKGFDVITSFGNGGSMFFMPRQRAVIEASDLIISNDICTTIGYSIFLGVPHCIIHKKEDDFNSTMVEVDDQLSENVPEDLFSEREHFSRVFGKMSSLKITQEQYELCNYYWGFNHVKDKNSMHDILCSLYKRRKRV